MENSRPMMGVGEGDILDMFIQELYTRGLRYSSNESRYSPDVLP
jgi:hypothetical protein